MLIKPWLIKVINDLQHHNHDDDPTLVDAGHRGGGGGRTNGYEGRIQSGSCHLEGDGD